MMHDEVTPRSRLYSLVDAPRGAIDRAVEIVDERYPGKRAWFAGSRVDGEPGPVSDLDVIVEVTPTHRKHSGGEPLNQGFGAGVYEDRDGVYIDVTEDEDGPIWRGPGSQVRFR